MTWQPASRHSQQAIHPYIYRLRFGVEEFRPRRSWNVTLLEQDCPSAFEWDGLQLRHTDFGTLLRLRQAPDWRMVTLKELPELLARPGDALPEGPARQQIRLVLQRDLEAGYYALGQRMSSMRRDPGVYCNWSLDLPAGHYRGMPSLYQAHPYLVAHRPGLALGMFLNSTWFSRFDLGHGHEDEIAITTQGGEIDLYVLAAENPADLCALLADLTGRAALPPGWALGFHQSRWGYQSQDEIVSLVDEFRQRQIPLDAVHLDIDYMDEFRSFTFHPQRFPDPEGLSAGLREKGVRLVTIIDPGIRFDLHSGYPVAREGALHGHFLRNPDGSPFSGYCWPDSALFTDYARADSRAWWGEQQRSLTERGVSGIWVDMNEPAVFSSPFSQGFSQQNPIPLATAQGAGEDSTVHAELHNLYGHQMAQATYEGLARLRPEERPWVLTRSAFVGTQRYAAAWMGDNQSWWEHLALTLPQLTSMGLSGSPFVGVDIGGFFGNTHAELFERWMEQAVFYPFMRNHSALGTRAQEPWRFGPEVEERVRGHIGLRYRLLPYVETLAWQAHRHGWPLLRPLFYDFPLDTEGPLYEDQAMFGPWIMLAPIAHPGHRQRMVYFPEGRWYDFWSERFVDGPGCQVWPAPLGQMPLFIRQGACLPVVGLRQSTSEPVQKNIWWLFPGPQSSQGLRINPEGEEYHVCLSSGQVCFDPPVAARVVVRRDRHRVEMEVDGDESVVCL
ncbi:alpha-glucosidase [bacterium]|nr:alpha-glucosidase [bacterium]